jgi:N-methylhydantoinase B
VTGLLRLVTRYGLDEFDRSVERIFEHGEAVVRAYFDQIPDGRYGAAGEMDSNGVGDDPVPFEIGVEVDGSDVVVDFTAAPDEQQGPVNSPLPSTVSAARMAVIALAGGSESVNEGFFRPIEVRLRNGSMFHPRPPAPIYLYFWSALQAVDVIHRSIAEAFPQSVRAGSGGDICCVIWWGFDANGNFWSDASNHVTGQGALEDGDGGAPLMHISSSAMRNSPVEVWEARHPIVIERFELIPDTGGAGQYRGGLAVEMTYRCEEDCFITSTVERTRVGGWGLAGGQPGVPNRMFVRHPDGSEDPIGKVTGLRLQAGSALAVVMGSGGGYGPQQLRAAAAMDADVRGGYVTAGHPGPGASSTRVG